MNSHNEGQVASDYEKFLNLLPWYLNNTLSREDKTWVEEYIAANSDASVDIELERSLASQTLGEVAHLPEDVGFSELMRRVRLDQTETAKRTKPQQMSIKDFFLSTFGGLFVNLGRPSASMAVTALAVVQAGIIASILFAQQHSVEPVYRSIAPPNTKLLGVQIRPSTTEQEFRQLFIDKNAEIVGGPSQLGEYRVSVPKNNFDEVAKQLEQSPFVESVTVIKNDPGS